MGELIHAGTFFRRSDAEATDRLLEAIDSHCPTMRGRDTINDALDDFSREISRYAFTLGALTFGANAQEADATFREMIAHVVIRRRRRA